jgi:hypothetical protein
MFGTLEKVTAAQASRRIGGSSIAAHANHVRFSLRATADWIRGDHSRKDWLESWKLSEVDDAGWSRLKEELRRAYEDAARAVESDGGLGAEQRGGAVSAVAHSAYHLGAIRQKVVGLNGD